MSVKRIAAVSAVALAIPLTGTLIASPALAAPTCAPPLACSSNPFVPPPTGKQYESAVSTSSTVDTNNNNNPFVGYIHTIALCDAGDSLVTGYGRYSLDSPATLQGMLSGPQSPNNNGQKGWLYGIKPSANGTGSVSARVLCLDDAAPAH